MYSHRISFALHSNFHIIIRLTELVSFERSEDAIDGIIASKAQASFIFIC